MSWVCAGPAGPAHHGSERTVFRAVGSAHHLGVPRLLHQQAGYQGYSGDTHQVVKEPVVRLNDYLVDFALNVAARNPGAGRTGWAGY